MQYNSIFSRSFNKHEQKKLGYGALFGCFLFVFGFFIMLNPCPYGPLPVYVINKKEPTCISMEMTDFCDIDVDVRIHGQFSSVFFASTDKTTLKSNRTWKIRPYARKGDKIAMKKTTEWSIKSLDISQKMPHCTKNHTVPAILFSTGGYAGNHFHDFSDLIIPLFITSRKFNGNVEFLITDRKSWWVYKYQAVLSNLSRHDIVGIDSSTEVHCFPSAIVGLQRHRKELTIDSYSTRDFKKFLRSSYSLNRTEAVRLKGGGKGRKPRLLVVVRRLTRSFTSTAGIREAAGRLGFEVVVLEPDVDLKRVGEMVNSCDVMMGVHGAGLTNLVFLPERAVLIQIVPFGGAEWVAQNFFGEPAKDMGIKYLEYKMSMEESTLIEQYPNEHVVLRDPKAIKKKGWKAFKSIYLDKQNVNLNVSRFEPTLLKALELLHH